MLPDSWVQRLFDQMSALYGSKFSDLWRGCDIEAVKRTWAEKLGGFKDHPEAIKRALDSLDESPFPPTLPEFLAMCRNAARREGDNRLRLEHQLTQEEKAKADEAADKALKAMKAMGNRDHHLWAKHPKSRLAFAEVLKLANAGESAFVEILDDLKRDGVSDGTKLLKRWDGADWVAA